jgi:DNA topoisomerase VI subunit A
MSKKRSKASADSFANKSSADKATLNPRDRKTLASIVGLADEVVVSAEKKRDPHLDIPARSLSNIRYNRQR